MVADDSRMVQGGLSSELLQISTTDLFCCAVPVLTACGVSQKHCLENQKHFLGASPIFRVADGLAHPRPLLGGVKGAQNPRELHLYPIGPAFRTRTVQEIQRGSPGIVVALGHAPHLTQGLIANFHCALTKAVLES